MYGFEMPKQRQVTINGRHAKERKVIKGIIHKYCPMCHKLVPETDFHYYAKVMDFKQGYCKQCKAWYESWRGKLCRDYHVTKLSDIPGLTLEDRKQDLKHYIEEQSQKLGGKLNED